MWTYANSEIALAQRWRSAQCVPLIGLRGERGVLESNFKSSDLKKKTAVAPPHASTRFGLPETSLCLGWWLRWFQFQNPVRTPLILPTIGLLRLRAACVRPSSGW
ncbi:hypothetical protein PoB_004482700 [Plakobranchus ocellatus]|uniref:Uncharacterized protein n=1 Tax=Plakobranchus ocellatus TaxID=259542 RepID=A0AAV4BG07_9GAST|nr:hypothetical protein PoB_004482700 [Plakobranchus ocellatus]